MSPKTRSAILQTTLILLIFAIYFAGSTPHHNNASPDPLIKTNQPDTPPSSPLLLAERAIQPTSPSLNQSSIFLDTATLLYQTFHQLNLAAAPFLSTFFTHVDAFAKESLLGAKPIADTFETGYGLLEFVIYSPDGVNIPWDAVGRIARGVHKGITRGLIGFFRASWEVTAGVWVRVVLGVPPFNKWMGEGERRRIDGGEVRVREV
ncbi:MAG: hypothetical protein Q9185_001522 [Variospora sp. 1 TL-2023]